jgi:hypothetical protein
LLLGSEVPFSDDIVDDDDIDDDDIDVGFIRVVLAVVI